MPRYSYKCPMCHVTQEIIKPMSQALDEETCTIPGCKGILRRDYRTDQPNVVGTEYPNEVASDSLAMHPEQIVEHQRSFPEIKVLPDGRPVFRDTKQHADYLKKIGWEKAPSKHARRSKLSKT